MNKLLFIEAYKWMYDSNKKSALLAFKNMDDESKKEIINIYKHQCKLSFYND